MDLLKDKLTSHNSIRRVYPTYNQEVTGKWFLKTTITKIKDAQQHFDNVVFTESDDLSKIQVQENVPMRINPTYNNNDFKTMAETINSLPPVQPVSTSTTYSKPPKKSGPLMASYVIDTPSYKQVTMKKVKNVISPKEVIEPTYTEIDWETKIMKITHSAA